MTTFTGFTVNQQSIIESSTNKGRLISDQNVEKGVYLIGEGFNYNGIKSNPLIIFEGNRLSALLASNQSIVESSTNKGSLVIDQNIEKGVYSYGRIKCGTSRTFYWA